MAAGLLAVALAWTWHDLSSRDGVPAVPWLSAWSEAHPDPRTAGEAVTRRHLAARAGQRRDDLADLALALAAGLAALALAPSPRPGWRGAAPRLLVVGGLTLGLVGAGRSLGELTARARSGRWDPGDHALAAVAGPLARDVEGWRRRMGAHDAVILAGTQDALLNTVAWALHPRPIHLVGVPVPQQLSPSDKAALGASLALGHGAPARWLLDLDALAAGRRDDVLVALAPFAGGAPP